MAVDKAEIWKAEYLKCLNATEAARRAGYKWPNKYGPELKQKYADEMDQCLKDNTLSPQEVLALLSQQALSEQSWYFTENGELDIKKLIADGKGHLIQSIEPTQYGRKIKFYDAQAALVHIGKQHGLFSDKVELKLTKEIDAILDTLESSLDADTYQRVLQALSAGEDSGATGEGPAE